MSAHMDWSHRRLDRHRVEFMRLVFVCTLVALLVPTILVMGQAMNTSAPVDCQK
jgi:hypothetical protein